MVDFSEPIQTQNTLPERALLSARLIDFLSQPLIEETAAVKSGERIARRTILRASCHLDNSYAPLRYQKDADGAKLPAGGKILPSVSNRRCCLNGQAGAMSWHGKALTIERIDSRTSFDRMGIKRKNSNSRCVDGGRKINVHRILSHGSGDQASGLSHRFKNWSVAHSLAPSSLQLPPTPESGFPVCAIARRP